MNREITPFWYTGPRGGRTEDISEDESYCSSIRDIEYYKDTGQFYWGTAKSWYAKNTILNNNSTIYELKKYQSIDINTHDDWKLALRLYKFNKDF